MLQPKTSSINSDPKKKPGRGRGRPRKTAKLPKRQRGKLIKTEADLNTSEDTERQKDIEVGNTALDRYKKKKRDEEEALSASIQASYNLRSAGDSGEKSINKEVSNKEENSNPVPDQPEKEKPTKHPNKRKGQSQETEDRKSKKDKNKGQNKEEQDGTVAEETEDRKSKKPKNKGQDKEGQDGTVAEEIEKDTASNADDKDVPEVKTREE